MTQHEAGWRRIGVALAGTALTMSGLAVTAGTAAAAPAVPPPPCAGTGLSSDRQCGLGGNDITQTPYYKSDEFYHCNPKGVSVSPAAEDECENRFEKTHPHDGPESSLPPQDQIKPGDALSPTYSGPTPDELAKGLGAVANKGPYGK